MNRAARCAEVVAATFLLAGLVAQVLVARVLVGLGEPTSVPLGTVR